MSRINYIITSWSGQRRGDVQGETGLDYLKKNISALDKYKHDIDQVTIYIPYNPNEPEDFREYLLNLPLRSCKYVIFDRYENHGLSYRSFSMAYETYRQSFDYYLFVEDDYYFCEDHFDKTLVKIYENAQPCSFLSQLITDSSSLEAVYQEYGEIPCGEGIPGGPRGDENNPMDRFQISFFNRFKNVTGKPMKCFSHITDYSRPIWAWNRRRVENLKANNKYFIAPYQL